MEYIFYGYTIRTAFMHLAERLKEFLENSVIHFSLTWEHGYYVFKVTADEAEAIELDDFLATDPLWKEELEEVEEY